MDAKRQLDIALSRSVSPVERTVQSDQPFQFLIETIPTIRNHVLSDEHPRNIAIVLSSFAPEVASNCMNGLDANLRISVIKRLCELDEVLEEEVTELATHSGCG